MSRVRKDEFERLRLRVHEFMAGVALHDVWAVELPKRRAGVTLDEFLRASGGRAFAPSVVVRGLLRARFLVGRLFGWDRERGASGTQSFAGRLTAEDRARSRVAPGTRDGVFRVVYRFENEQLVEIVNRTVHPGALSALVETERGYRFYFAVYVERVGRLTPLYMALIDPVRRLIVYPSLLRSVRRTWDASFGPA